MNRSQPDPISAAIGKVLADARSQRGLSPTAAARTVRDARGDEFHRGTLLRHEAGYFGGSISKICTTYKAYGLSDADFAARLAVALDAKSEGLLRPWNPLTNSANDYLNILTRFEKSSERLWMLSLRPPLRSSPRDFNRIVRENLTRAWERQDSELNALVRRAGEIHEDEVRKMYKSRDEHPAILQSVLLEGTILRIIAAEGPFSGVTPELSYRFLKDLRDVYESNRYLVCFANGARLLPTTISVLRALSTLTIFDRSLSVRKHRGSFGLTFHQSDADITDDHRVVEDLRRCMSHEESTSGAKAKLDQFLYFAERPQLIKERAGQTGAARVDWMKLSLADFSPPKKWM